MKKLNGLILCLFLITGIQASWSQETLQPPRIYNPQADASKEIDQAIGQANAENKHVFVQVGGNWCPWCLRFHAYVQGDPEIKKLLDDQFVYVLLNYSPENKNAELLRFYRNPGRMGFPVFLILDRKGNLIHTQDSGLLEEGNTYNKNKVIGFLRNWTPAALTPTGE